MPTARLLYLTCLALSLCLTPLRAGAQFAGGDGSEASPFRIATPEQLALLHEYCDGFYSFMLTNDIDLKHFDANGDGKGWLPVGSEAHRLFNGKLNGNGKTISNLTINRPDMKQVGLFGYLRGGAEVANLTLANVQVVGYEDVGALAGLITSGSVVSGCRVTSGTVQGYLAVGGLVGYLHTGSLVKNSSVRVQVYGHAGYTGGLAGEVYASGVECSTAKGAVRGAATGTGGLVGYLCYGSRVRSSYATAQVHGLPDAVRGSDSRYLGGLVGHAFDRSRIEGCYAAGAVSGTESVGGLLGFGHRGTVSSANVALNPSVEGRGDVFALNGHTADNAVQERQYTRSDMALREKGVAKYNPSSPEMGINFSFAGAKVPFYRGIGWKFGISEQEPWVFNEGTNLPMLWFEGQPATSLRLNTHLVSLRVGEVYDLLAATVEPDSARLKAVQWRSANAEVASVDPASGVVTARRVGFTTLTVRSIDGGFEAECRVSVLPRASVALGVDKEGIPPLKVYPNPVRDLLYVEATEEIVSLTVYSAAGVLLLERRGLSAPATSIDVAGLANGVYVVVVRTRSGQHSLKFIVI